MLDLQGLTFTKEGVTEILKSKDLYDFNSMTNPRHIYPSEKQLAIRGKKINIVLDSISVNVIALDYRK